MPLLVALIALLSVALVATTPGRVSSYAAHAPIRILGDVDFTAPGSGSGCECVTGGSGTPADPYVIEGWEIDMTAAHGIEVRNTTSAFVLQDLFVHTDIPTPVYAGVFWVNVTRGDALNVTVSGGFEGLHVDSIGTSRLANNTILGVSTLGIHIRSSANVAVTGNNVTGGTYCAWLSDSSNVTIEANRFRDATEGLVAERVTNLTVARNEAVDQMWIGFDLWDTPNASIRENRAERNVGYGILLGDVPGSLVDANSIRGSQRGIGIGGDARGLVVSGNDIDSGEYGFEISQSSGAVVRQNHIANQTVDAMDVDTSGVTIEENEVAHNWNGVFVYRGVNVVIRRNNITDHHGAGVVASSGTAVLDNLIAGNAVGIRAWFSDNVTIVNNTLADNERGIDLLYAFDGIVHHNDFLDNSVQASEGRGDRNLWDDGYPSGGNHWSDYVGVDDCSGPNQDVCPDPDGIGDTPYVINPSNQDRYPLMAPRIVRDLPPGPPVMLPAVLVGTNRSDLRIVWQPSLDDGGRESDIGGYEVWTGTAYDPVGSSYSFLASLPAGSASYVHVGAGVGDTANRFYRVRAIETGTGRYATTAEQGGKFVRPVTTGPNLLSVPFEQADWRVETVFGTIPWIRARTYEGGAWQTNNPSTGAASLRTLDRTTGIWIEMGANATWTVAGLVPRSTTVPLTAGWNLVGYPSMFRRFASSLTVNLRNGAVEGFAALPPYYLTRLPPAGTVEAGNGYWVYTADVGHTLTFNN